MSATPPRFSDTVWPEAAAYWITNARVPLCMLADAAAHAATDREDGVACVDLRIENGRIARLAPAGTAGSNGGPAIDLNGRQAWPMLVDLHTHLDRGHTVVRSPNASGSFADALSATAADRLRWTHEDLLLRMSFGLRCAYAHGVSAIRTHLDSVPEQAERSWGAFREMRAEWAGKVALQGVSLVPIDLFRGEGGDRLAALVARSGGVLGGVTRATGGTHGVPPADLDSLLDRVFELAARHDLALDFHVDETNDPRAAALPHVARAALRHRYQGRVVAGHCCSLAVQPADEADRTLDLLAEAGVAVVTLPTVNLYLQDRGNGRTPRWRGVTLVHEMRRRGIAVAAAGDNCRDCFHAYGDHDMVDTFRQAVRILHLDHPLSDAPALVGPAPAAIARLTQHGRLAIGGPARLIVFNARSLNEIVCRSQADRIVIDNGRRSSARVPDYAELWDNEMVCGAAT
jgi:cytosine/creatinine deaminase